MRTGGWDATSSYNKNNKILGYSAFRVTWLEQVLSRTRHHLGRHRTGARNRNVWTCYKSDSHKYLKASSQVEKGLLESVGNFYRSVREKQGIIAGNQTFIGNMFYKQ